MFADPEIPVGVADPFHVEIILKTEGQLQIRPPNQFIKDDAIINARDAHRAPVAFIKQLPAAFLQLRQAH